MVTLVCFKNIAFLYRRVGAVAIELEPPELKQWQELYTEPEPHKKDAAPSDISLQ
jgi:hypothetical protein